MKIMQFFQDYHVPFETEGHKHCRPGWVNTACPFCTGNPGLHLGYNLERDYFYCWRCGWHSTVETLAILTNTTKTEIKKILPKYAGKAFYSKKETKHIPKIKAFKLPSGTTNLTEHHKKYLAKRKFDPEKLEQEWGLKSTGPVSKLENIDYKNRILIPIYWNGKIVSFQTRTPGKAIPKYKTCSSDRERIHHKTILYGKQEEWTDIGICVEGVTDVWRLGSRAFATFGIAYKTKQVIEIIKHFKRVAVMFDEDPQAQKQADKLVEELRLGGVYCFKVKIQGDPGDMEQDDADHLVREVTKIWR